MSADVKSYAFRPYDADSDLCACCGNHHQTKFCLNSSLATNEQTVQAKVIEAIAIKAIFPH